MKNLALSATTRYAFEDAEISAVAIDLDQNSLYVASEHIGPDADVQVKILKVEVEEKGSSFEVCFNLPKKAHNLIKIEFLIIHGDSVYGRCIICTILSSSFPSNNSRYT